MLADSLLVMGIGLPLLAEKIVLFGKCSDLFCGQIFNRIIDDY